VSLLAADGAIDPFDPRLARHASEPLRAFNGAGVLTAADVHVARRLGALAGEGEPSVLLAVALAARGPRLGHVHVDLAQIRASVAVDTEQAVDLEALPWPAVGPWTAAVAASPLVAGGDGDGAAADVRPLRLIGTRLYLSRYWTEEVAVAGALRALDARAVTVAETTLADGLARLFGPGADHHQSLAAATAVRRRFSVVAGGPGTGKTTTVSRIVALLCEQAGDGPFPLIALAAPTGRAAARLEEAVRGEAAAMAVGERLRAHLESLRATTIHRLLGARPGSAVRFRHDANRRLAHDVVIVDEASMVSLSLMARLIEALRADARLVLVGDPAQLASIEAGAVLGDIVGAAPAGGPVVVLDRVHRYRGGLARLAEAIRAGDADAVVALLREGAPDVTWVPSEPSEAGSRDGSPAPPSAIVAPAVAAARATVTAARAGDAGAALAALGSFRILCAHRRGPAGVAIWTGLVQEGLRAAMADLDTDDRWYVGRPLLVGENDYELRLYNGDTGVVIRRGDGRVSAAFTRGGETIEHWPARLSAVDTVYAMTIHKSQGSQFDHVAVVLPDPDSRLLTRELLYTAATRARRGLILAGDEASVRVAVDRPIARASGLGQRLWGVSSLSGSGMLAGATGPAVSEENR
jgi:exodeoxyribonuclease V alpha subunit